MSRADPFSDPFSVLFVGQEERGLWGVIEFEQKKGFMCHMGFAEFAVTFLLFWGVHKHAEIGGPRELFL